MTKEELITKVCNILDIEEKPDLDIGDLYAKLKNYRDSKHPDNYMDPDLKIKNEEEFKNLRLFLEKLEDEIEQQQKSRNLVKFEVNSNDKAPNISALVKLRRIEDENHDLVIEKTALSTQNDNLNKQIRDAKKVIATITNELVREKTKPKITVQKVSVGITGLLAILTTLNKDVFGLISVFQSQGVLSSTLVPVIFWIVFSILSVNITYVQYRKTIMNKLLGMLYTSNMRRSFSDQIGYRGYFSESNVVDFVKNQYEKILAQNILFNRIDRLLKRSISDIEIDDLSRAFITKMEEDNLIIFKGSSKGLRIYEFINNKDYYL
ncbi:MAG: hypothetical protein ACHQQQ_15130 [Bacteroidota bacterium]